MLSTDLVKKKKKKNSLSESQDVVRFTEESNPGVSCLSVRTGLWRTVCSFDHASNSIPELYFFKFQESVLYRDTSPTNFTYLHVFPNLHD